MAEALGAESTGGSVTRSDSGMSAGFSCTVPGGSPKNPPTCGLAAVLTAVAEKALGLNPGVCMFNG